MKGIALRQDMQSSHDKKVLRDKELLERQKENHAGKKKKSVKQEKRRM